MDNQKVTEKTTEKVTEKTTEKVTQKKSKKGLLIGLGVIALITVVSTIVIYGGRGTFFKGDLYGTLPVANGMTYHVAPPDVIPCAANATHVGDANCPFKTISEAVNAVNAAPVASSNVEIKILGGTTHVFTETNPVLLKNRSIYNISGNWNNDFITSTATKRANVNAIFTTQNVQMGGIRNLQFTNINNSTPAPGKELLHINFLGVTGGSFSFYNNLISNSQYAKGVVVESNSIQHKVNVFNNTFSYSTAANGSMIQPKDSTTLATLNIYKNVFNHCTVTGNSDALIKVIGNSNVYLNLIINSDAKSGIKIDEGASVLVANNTLVGNSNYLFPDSTDPTAMSKHGACISYVNTISSNLGNTKIYNNIVDLCDNPIIALDSAIVKNNSFTNDGKVSPRYNTTYSANNPSCTYDFGKMGSTNTNANEYYKLGPSTTCIDKGYYGSEVSAVVKEDFFGNLLTTKVDIGFFKGVATDLCGNGGKETGESCDDGNNTSGDGCSSTCTLESNYTCNNAIPNVCTYNAPTDFTDIITGITVNPASFNPGAGQTTTVNFTVNTSKQNLLNPYYDISIYNPNGSMLKKIATNLRTPAATVWDGKNNGVVVTDGLYKIRASAKDTSTGTNKFIKDINVSITSATSSAVCGNGNRETGETCDDGDTASGDGCSASCSLETGWTCNTATPNVCTHTPVCGDGTREGPEACDDGDTVSADGCSASCSLETGWTCNAATPNVCTHTPVCGDGTREGAEVCDDGNTVSSDGCNASCTLVETDLCTNLTGYQLTVPAGYVRVGNACNLATQAAVCGNSSVEAGEACDDGNTSNLDSCTNNCIIALCGDNYKRTGVEECDDGNTTNGDGCSASCRNEAATIDCGNGIKESGEQCDDGNNTNTDGCLNTCKLPICGDGKVWANNEECDDGDTTSGDGCSSSCHDEEITVITEDYECGEWSDVSQSDPEYGIWVWECQRGILRGYPDGTLGIENKLTRAELLALAFRASEYEGTGVVDFDLKNCFNDGHGQWYEPYACTGKDEGFIVGYAGNVFKGGNTVILAEGLKMFLGALGREFTTTSDPWYYDMVWDAHLNDGLPYSLRDQNDIISTGTVELTRRKAINMLYRLQIM